MILDLLVSLVSCLGRLLNVLSERIDMEEIQSIPEIPDRSVPDVAQDLLSINTPD